MDDQQRHSVFTLLYAIVLIDNRVIKVEVDLFFARVESFLKTTKLVESLKAKAIISNWFVQNYKDILHEMKLPNRKDYLIGHVENLKFYGQRQDVFNIMLEIAHADNEFHTDEREFLKTVAQIWKLDLPKNT